MKHIITTVALTLLAFTAQAKVTKDCAGYVEIMQHKIDETPFETFVLDTPSGDHHVTDIDEAVELNRAWCIRSVKPMPRLGWTTKQVEASRLGKPLEINRTVTSSYTHEQWVYSQGLYLYFDNGRLTGYQN